MRIREGYLFFKKRYPSLTPSQRKFALRVCSLNGCTRCAIGCGVHGFAMNPCDSSPFSTAPYYREARVTLPQRQTACRMWHCCARRIDRFLGRRKLGCTPTRWAERHPQGVCRIRKAAKQPTAAQQRIVGAEANRIVALNAASPHAGISIPEGKRSFEIETANLKPFSWGIERGLFSFTKENSPL